MSGESLLSVPHPAMLVATVTAFFCPASLTISASWAWSTAFNTWCEMLSAFNSPLSFSLSSMLRVPFRMGLPVACTRFASSTTSFHLASLVKKNPGPVLDMEAWPMGGDSGHRQLVYLPEFLCCLLAGAGYTRQFFIKTEETLKN